MSRFRTLEGLFIVRTLENYLFTRNWKYKIVFLFILATSKIKKGDVLIFMLRIKNIMDGF